MVIGLGTGGDAAPSPGEGRASGSLSEGAVSRRLTEGVCRDFSFESSLKSVHNVGGRCFCFPFGASALLQPLLNNPMDCATYTRKLTVNIAIGKPKHNQSDLLQRRRAPLVILQGFSFKVLRPVQFNHQTRLMAIKIDNVSTDRLLSLKSDRIGAEKVIPEMLLLFCCIFPQIFCQIDQIPIVGERHRIHSFQNRGTTPPVGSADSPLGEGAFGAGRRCVTRSGRGCVSLPL